MPANGDINANHILLEFDGGRRKDGKAIFDPMNLGWKSRREDYVNGSCESDNGAVPTLFIQDIQ